MVRRTVGIACLTMALAVSPRAAMAVPQANTPTSIPASGAPPANAGADLSVTSRPQTASYQNEDQRIAPQSGRTPDAAQAAPPVNTSTIGDTNANEHLPLGRAVASGNAIGGGPHGEAASGWGWLWSTAAALGGVIGLILLLRTVLGRVTGRTTTPARTSIIEVLSRINLGPRSYILVVRLGRRILVLGEAPTGLSMLANIEDPEEVAGLLQALTAAGVASASGLFNETLAQFDGQYGDEGEALSAGESPTTIHVERARDHVSSLAARLRAMSGKAGGA